MKFLVGVFLAIMVAASPGLAADDAAPAGKIVWAATTNSEGFPNGVQSFFFFFRSRDGKHRDYASYRPDNHLFGHGSDFTADGEKGGVQILTVPSGDWEMYSYAVDGPTPDGTVTFVPKAEFSVPVTVKPGGTVYIGSYRAIWAEDKNASGARRVTGIDFLVSDLSGRDIATAKNKDHAIGDVAVAIPDFASLGVPGFQLAPTTDARKSPVAFRFHASGLSPPVLSLP